MNVISCEYLLTCNENFDIFKDFSICFDEEIIDIGHKDVILQKYPKATFINLGKNYLVMPSLINSHTHLEFSANKISLDYGSFSIWLRSMLKNKNAVVKNSTKTIAKHIDDMLRCGVGTLGAISSFGMDLEACRGAYQNVIFFNEIAGLIPSKKRYESFLDRFRASYRYKSDRFSPALSVHSPYSTNKDFAKRVIELAKSNNFHISTHFMESKDEREFFDFNRGGLKEVLEEFFPISKSIYKDTKEYINLFRGLKVGFVHSVFSSDEELELIRKNGGFVTHCFRSNRLLSQGSLDLNRLIELGICFDIATDGLSSNITLNMWDELRAVLFGHTDMDILKLSKLLLFCVTREPAKNLGLNYGMLSSKKCANIIVVKLLGDISDTKQLLLSLILHTNRVDKIFINGQER